MSYCKCDKPKTVENEAYGKKFKVCAKSQGGCGCEIEVRTKQTSFATVCREYIGSYDQFFMENDCDFGSYTIDLDDVPFFHEKLIVHESELKLKRR